MKQYPEMSEKIDRIIEEMYENACTAIEMIWEDSDEGADERDVEAMIWKHSMTLADKWRRYADSGD